jgi:hypothetical protein
MDRTNGALSTSSARWVINLAVETDYELYVNAGSSSSNVTTFIGSLVGAMSTIYNRDLSAQVVLSSLTINSSVSDPFTVVPGSAGTWNGSAVTYSTYHALLEFGDRWHNSAPSSNPRSTTALISGKSQPPESHGSMCCATAISPHRSTFRPASDTGAGVTRSTEASILPRIFRFPIPMRTRRRTRCRRRTTGRFYRSHTRPGTLQSAHTHCITLSPADQATYGRTHVDHCYASESGCYSGTISVPAEKGTIMSYCHLRPGGATNSRWLFGKTGEASYVVPNAMKSAIQSATPNLSAITAPASLASGASGTASVTNVGGLTYAWTITNGTINSGQGTNSINFTATANPTNVKVTATNTAGCSITDNKDITVTSATYNAPAGVTATAQSSTTFSCRGRCRLELRRSSTTSIAARTARCSRRRIRRPSGDLVRRQRRVGEHGIFVQVRSSDEGAVNESVDSNRDLATTVMFTDPTLVSGTTLIKAATSLSSAPPSTPCAPSRLSAPERTPIRRSPPARRRSSACTSSISERRSMPRARTSP